MKQGFKVILPWIILAFLLVYYIKTSLKAENKNCPMEFRPFTASDIDWIQNRAAMDDPDLIQYIRQRWLIYPQGNIIEPNEEKHHSQVGQSRFVDEFLKQKRNGFFIECGAADGIGLSNSIFFEKSRNWTGLLVEPNAAYSASLSKNRPRSYLMNTCLSTFKTATPLDFEFNDKAKVLSKLKNLTLGKAKHLRWNKIHCFPLYSILRAIGVDTVDYFSLDVEGAELAILKNIPWDKIRINVLTIEYRAVPGTPNTTSVSAANLEQLRKFFKELKIYTEVKILKTLDVVFARKDIGNTSSEP